MTSTMTPPKPAPPPTKAAANGSSTKAATFAKKSKPRKIGERIVLNAVEGWGKTTMASQAKGAAILQVGGETGYEKLLSRNLVPLIPFDSVSTWQEYLATIEAFDVEGVSTLVIDAITGAETMCRDYVCQSQFNGDWGERGFASYGKGNHATAMEWEKGVQALDRLALRGLNVILLSHAVVQSFTEPGNEAYDRYVPDLQNGKNSSTWSPINRWADAVLFGNFKTLVDDSGNRPVGVGGKHRWVYAEQEAAFTAKNRYSLPAKINLSAEPSKEEAADDNLKHPIKLAAHRLWGGIFNNA